MTDFLHHFTYVLFIESGRTQTLRVNWSSVSFIVSSIDNVVAVIMSSTYMIVSPELDDRKL